MSPQRPSPGRPTTWNWWLRSVMADFYAERDRWDDGREAFSKGYSTEAAEFDVLFPPPQLRVFLVDHAYLHLVDEGVAA